MDLFVKSVNFSHLVYFHRPGTPFNQPVYPSLCSGKLRYCLYITEVRAIFRIIRLNWFEKLTDSSNSSLFHLVRRYYIWILFKSVIFTSSVFSQTRHSFQSASSPFLVFRQIKIHLFLLHQLILLLFPSFRHNWEFLVSIYLVVG